MSAHGDDLRYFYSAVLGNATSFAITDAGSTKVPAKLEPGRYLAYPIDLVGRIWLRQGPFADVAANAGTPSAPMDANSLKAFEFTVTPGEVLEGKAVASKWDGLAGIASAGGSATLIVLKISRDRM